MGSLAQWNCNGLGVRWDKFNAFLLQFAPDIMILNEIHRPPMRPLRIKNYTVFHVQGAGEWGTAVLTRNGRVTGQEVYRSTDTDGMEVILVKVRWMGTIRT